MAIEHDRGAWGNWLRTVKAAKGANVLQTNQAIAEDVQPTVQVEDVGHLVAPLAWTQSAFGLLQAGGGAGTYTAVEIRAVRPFWLRWFWTLLQSSRVYTVDTHGLATADQTPASVFGAAPNIRYRTGALAGAPPANAIELPPLAAASPFWMNTAQGLFVPQGKILVAANGTANQNCFFYAMVVEVPSHESAT